MYYNIALVWLPLLLKYRLAGFQGGVLIFVIFVTPASHEIFHPRIFSRLLRMRCTTWRIRCKQNARVKRQQQLQERLSLAIYIHPIEYAGIDASLARSGVTKFKTTKINSEDPRQLFTKICTPENYPLYGSFSTALWCIANVRMATYWSEVKP